MKRRFRTARVALAALLATTTIVTASPAHAFRLGLTILGSVGGVAMSDLNDAISLLNLQYDDDMQPVSFDAVETATSYGVGLHSPIGTRLFVGVEWERLVASSGVGGPLDRNTIAADADILRASVAVDLIPENKFRFGFEGGVGYLASRAEQTIFVDDEKVLATDLDGNGTAYNASMFWAIPATPSLEFAVSLGYRWAKIDNLDHELTTNIPDAEPQPLSSLDWSGVYGRAQVTIYIL
jgi:hypothetical protein